MTNIIIFHSKVNRKISNLMPYQEIINVNFLKFDTNLIMAENQYS